MAFHPFRHFRKHQKVYFALLTILCMITFIFSFGAADPIQGALRWIGMSRSQGDAVLPLYGKTVYTGDLDKVRLHRQLASEFLNFGILYATPLDSVLTDIRKKVEREKKGPHEGLENPVQMGLQALDSVRGGMMMFSTPESRHQQIIASLQRVQMLLDRPDVQKDGEQFRALDAIATALAFQAWFTNPQKPPQEYYFGGTPRTEELLDFLLWKHQADKLGINLAPADVCRQVNRAWGNGDFLKPDGKLDQNDWVRRFLGGSQKINKTLTARDLLDALTEEYRVAIAKEALLGTGTGVRFFRGAFDGIHHSPTFATPDEFLKYFQEQRTTVAVSMLPLAVEKFVAKVEHKPSEEDLRNLYARYKDDEPSPTRRQPGFKEPRRVKVAYFSYRPDSPFARKLAARAIELLPLFRLGGPAGTFPAGGGLAWAAALAAPADVDSAIRAQYEKYREEQTDRVLKYDKQDDSSFRARFGQGFDVTDRQAAAAQAPVAALGQLLGGIGTGGTPLAAPTAWIGTTEVYERAAASAVASTILAGASSSPLVAATLSARYVYSTQSLESVRPQMVERFESTLARRSMETNVLAMRKELDKLLSSRSEQKVEEFLKKSIADYGLEHYHAMPEPQTPQEMIAHPDPVLKDLQKAYEETTDNPFFQIGGDQTRPDFVSAMFRSFELSAIERQFGMDRPVKSQQFRSRSGDEVWVFWRSEDKPAHVRPFEAVRAQVEKAWYFEQARRLARKEAERIQASLKEQHANPADALKFLREQKQGDVFELSNVAQLVSPIFKLPGHKFRPDEFRPYQPPKDLIAYPPGDFVDQLLKLKEPGSTTVVADQPVSHFYIAVLMEKPQVPDRRDFYEIYSFSGAENRLWQDMMNERRRTYYRKLMEQLRAEATTKLEGGEYVIPDKVANRGESGSSDSEE
jgi:hypothetical protein